MEKELLTTPDDNEKAKASELDQTLHLDPIFQIYRYTKQEDST
jgi:hypothetical protein